MWKKALWTAYQLLKPGGVLLITALVAEDFKENNFVYAGSRGDTEITLFENNHMPGKSGTTYEATLVYLIRRRGRLKTCTDRHVTGIFNLSIWINLFKKAEFPGVKHKKIKHLYDSFISGKGEYHLTVFVCQKAATGNKRTQKRLPQQQRQKPRGGRGDLPPRPPDPNLVLLPTELRPP